jgi:glutaredoxin
MKKLALLCLIIVSVITFSGCKYLNNGNSNDNPSQDVNKQNSNVGTSEEGYVINQEDTVLFWGEGCPHCVNVDKFLSDNSALEEKLKIKKIEVFSDLKGQKAFMDKVNECQLTQAGVPLLYTGGKCFQGDVPVIEELKKNLSS